jgi:YVTN family beta-propeller protein
MFAEKHIFFNILRVVLLTIVITGFASGIASGDMLKADIVAGMNEDGRTAAARGDFPNNYMYAATGETDKIFVIDPCTISIVASIPIGPALDVHKTGDKYSKPSRAPEPMALKNDGMMLYTANERDKTISVIDTMARRELATRPVDGEPESILFNDGRGVLYVGIEDKNKVLVIDPRSLSTISTIPVDKGPDGLAMSGDGSKLFVSNEGDNTVSVIDTGLLRVVDTIKAGDKPDFLVPNPVLGHLYVVNDESRDVSVIDMATDQTIGTIEVGVEPESAAVNKAGSCCTYATRPIKRSPLSTRLP